MSHSTQETRLTPSPRFARRLIKPRCWDCGRGMWCGGRTRLAVDRQQRRRCATGHPAYAHQTIVWAIQGGVSNAVGSEGRQAST